MIVLDERILADGTHARTYASLVGDRVRIHDDVASVGHRTPGAASAGAPSATAASGGAASGASSPADAHDGRADGVLSIVALDRVMTRYGRELEPALLVASPGDGARSGGARPALDPSRVTGALDLPGGYRLARMRYHAPVDATGRDYLVWERPEADPLAAVATMATAALRYLVLRLATDDKPAISGI